MNKNIHSNAWVKRGKPNFVLFIFAIAALFIPSTHALATGNGTSNAKNIFLLDTMHPDFQSSFQNAAFDLLQHFYNPIHRRNGIFNGLAIIHTHVSYLDRALPNTKDFTPSRQAIELASRVLLPTMSRLVKNPTEALPPFFGTQNTELMPKIINTIRSQELLNGLQAELKYGSHLREEDLDGIFDALKQKHQRINIISEEPRIAETILAGRQLHAPANREPLYSVQPKRPLLLQRSIAPHTDRRSGWSFHSSFGSILNH